MMDDVFTVELCRENKRKIITIASAGGNENKIIFLDNKFVYLKFHSFDVGVSKIILEKNMTIILDLREHCGGSLKGAFEFLQSMIVKKHEVFFLSKSREVKRIIISSKRKTRNKIIVVLNNATMSSAEIVAKILRQDGGIIIGKVSYGKDIVQKSVKLNSRFSLLVPIYQCIVLNEHRKIYPDYYIESIDTMNEIEIKKIIEELGI